MAGKGQPGYCYLCGAELSRVGMRMHLLKKHAEGEQVCRLIKVEDKYNKNYWLYLDMPLTASLIDLDDFLRKIWLECCDHLSAFFETGYDELPMTRKIRGFDEGHKLRYEYDFGSTTDLVVTFMAKTKRPMQSDAVRLLARNKPFEYKCRVCGKPAAYIATELIYREDDPYFCKDCYEERSEFLLRITNSPRMGVCGYEGELDVYAFEPK